MAAASYGFKKGNKGVAVKQIQRRFLELGYDLGRWGADGIFGRMLDRAVRAFQKLEQIKVDGIVGPVTVSRLGIYDLMVGELVAWDAGGSSLIPMGARYDIIDVWSGTRLNVTRTSGSLHNDVEPTTAEDGAKYKSLWGRWQWLPRRPILICWQGRYIAASTHCMPHAGREDKPAWVRVSNRSGNYGTGTNYDTIKGNGVEGHICHHLYRSRVHKSNKMDSRHQKCVMIAAGKRAG